MPNCRNCGARLSKFDKDICPVCGTKNPLEGVTSETIEITSQIDLNGFNEGQKVVRRKKTLLILFLSCGFLGIPFFYLKRQKFGFIWLAINLVIYFAAFSLFLFLLKFHPVFAIIIPFILLYLINTVTGFIYNYQNDLKDGEGEFVH